MGEVEVGLLEKVAKRLREPPSYVPAVAGGRSILVYTASAYRSGLRGTADEMTQPTGFDPHAAALFESVIESAFLVASVDHHFDPAERNVFKQVIASACKGHVSQQEIDALVSDLAVLLLEDGTDKRVAMVAKNIQKPEQAREVLRVAGLIAAVSGGVSEEESQMLSVLAQAFGMPSDSVELALEEVRRALA